MSAPRLLLQALAVSMTVLLMVSCGGGGSGSVAEGGIGGTGISMGSVTGFGSVYVNGVRFETGGNTRYLINGSSSQGGDDKSAIGLGMVVRVEGQVNGDGVTGSAERIVYSRSLLGPVENPGAAGFALLGQAVEVTSTTVFAGHNGVVSVVGPASLQPGDLVEVSGFPRAPGGFVATRVEAKGRPWAAGDIVEVKGVVIEVGPSQLTLSGLVVDYFGASRQFEPALKQWVKAEGTYDGDGTLSATDLELEEDPLGGKGGDETELEGIASVAGEALSVNGVAVQVVPGTEFKGFSQLADLDGRRVEVEGTVSGTGLLAEEIELHGDAEYGFSGTVTAANEGPIRGTGTLTLFGQAIAVTAATVVEDKAVLFDRLDPDNTFISVKLAQTGGQRVAAKIEIEGSPETEEIEGPITARNEAARSVVVAGVVVDMNDLALSAFFDQLSDGDRVELDGHWDRSRQTFIATGAESD